MQELATEGKNPHDSIENRDVRALTEYMTVLAMDGEIYSVTTQSGSEYRVDAIEGRCTCPDYEYRDDVEECKHIRRVRFATGERSVPAWIDVGKIDTKLGEHVEGGPIIVASDGGQLLDSATDEGSRPEDCECGDWNEGLELPCWPCYRDGHETPAQNE